jgi:hypothetical protein
MPSNLTDTSSFDAVSGPVAVDIRNAASVRNALQTLANRTRYLYERLLPLADIATLKAISSPADGLVRTVKSKGVYVFDSASVLGEAIPFVVAPNAGSGRWLHVLYAVQANASGLATLDGSTKVPLAQLYAGTASGLATLDGSSKVTASQLRGRLISATTHQIDTDLFTSSTSFGFVDGFSISVVAGDILFVDAVYICNATPVGTAGAIKHQIVDGSTIDNGSWSACPNQPWNTSVPISYVHNVLNTGTLQIKTYLAAPGSGTATIFGSTDQTTPISRVTACLYRP